MRCVSNACCGLSRQTTPPASISGRSACRCGMRSHPQRMAILILSVCGPCLPRLTPSCEGFLVAMSLHLYRASSKQQEGAQQEKNDDVIFDTPITQMLVWPHMHVARRAHRVTHGTGTCFCSNSRTKEYKEITNDKPICIPICCRLTYRFCHGGARADQCGMRKHSREYNRCWTCVLRRRSTSHVLLVERQSRAQIR